MNEKIELHDSKLATVSLIDGSWVISLSPAYVHRSSGVPGTDAGTGHYQPATLTFAGVSHAPLPIELPISLDGGSIQIGDVIHDNLIPASGSYDGTIELALALVTGERWIIRGGRVTIELSGAPSRFEDFSP